MTLSLPSLPLITPKVLERIFGGFSMSAPRAFDTSVFMVCQCIEQMAFFDKLTSHTRPLENPVLFALVDFGTELTGMRRC